MIATETVALSATEVQVLHITKNLFWPATASLLKQLFKNESDAMAEDRMSFMQLFSHWAIGKSLLGIARCPDSLVCWKQDLLRLAGIVAN